MMGAQTRSPLTEPYRTSWLSRVRQQSAASVFQSAIPSLLADAVTPVTPPVFVGDIGFGSSSTERSGGSSSSPLHLVPKFAAAVQYRLPKWADCNPSPDWDLEDLREELESIGAGLRDASLPCDTFRQKKTSAVSWQSLRVVADFGREQKPFVMRLSESDLEVSDEEEDESHPQIQVPERGENHASSPSEKSAHNEAASPNRLLSKTENVQAELYELEKERLLRVQEEVRLRQQHVEARIVEEAHIVKEAHLKAEEEERRKAELAQQEDTEFRRSVAKQIESRLSAVKRDQEQRSKVEQHQIEKDQREKAEKEEKERQAAAAEEQRKKDLAEAERKVTEKKLKAAEEQRKFKAAEEQRKAEEAEERKKSAEAEERRKAVAAQEAERIKTSTEAEEKKLGGQAVQPRVSARAAEAERERRAAIQGFENDSKSLLSNPALRKGLILQQRNIIKILQQVAKTEEQVRNKTLELGQLIEGGTAPKPFLVITLGQKLLSQCEIQILRLPPFAFPLAQVVVNVAARIPSVMDAVLAKLNEVCIFTVPKYFVFSKDQFPTDGDYYKTLGYTMEDGKLESTDDYVARMRAYVTFYAAITQTEVANGTNPHGLKHAWSWCASLLNKLPANRSTASALEAFLVIAGYRLFREYPKPFMMMMEVIVNEYIPSLKKQNDEDAIAVVRRLETYLQMQEFRNEPEGRKMIFTDASTALKA